MSKFLIEQCTKMNQEAQNQNLRLFVRVELETKLKIFKEQKQLFHKLKSEHNDIDNTILTLSSFILAIHLIIKELDDVNFNAIKLRGKNNKAKIKRQKLLDHWAIIRVLRLEQNMSFRKISQYLLKYHRFEVSYSTIYGLWVELENNTKMEENNGI